MPETLPYLIKVTDETAATLRSLHPEIRSLIKSALKTILESPHAGKLLKDDLKGLRSYRVKRYRIIYRLRLDENQIEIIAVGPRKNIYEETFRLLQGQR